VIKELEKEAIDINSKLKRIIERIGI